MEHRNVAIPLPKNYQNPEIRINTDSYGHLTIEQGYYTAYNGDTTFHGSRIGIPPDKVHLLVEFLRDHKVA